MYLKRNFVPAEMFCSITSKDVLLRISLGSIKRYQKAESHVNVEKIAHRFNQVRMNDGLSRSVFLLSFK